MPVSRLANIGARGLVVCGTDGTFKYVEEGMWRAQGTPYTPTAATNSLIANGAVTAPLPLGANPPTVFVNFDELPAPTDPPQGPINTPPPGANGAWVIVIREGANMTQVPSSLASSLSPGSEGDAGVLVTRGAVVATIPKNNIPSGSFCVLVNMSSSGMRV